MAAPKTKKQLVAILTKLGIAHDPEAKNADLEALIPGDYVDETTDGVTNSNDNEFEDLDVDSITIAYQDQFKGPSERVFSKADHGKEFLKAAKQFKDKFNGERVV